MYHLCIHSSFYYWYEFWVDSYPHDISQVFETLFSFRVNSKDADQFAHLSTFISTFAFHCLENPDMVF